VYNQPTSHFFVTDPFSNSVFVVDSATEKKIATIAVPGAYGIDQTPDQSTLYVGTLIGDVYALNPVTMQVTRRYIASEIGPYGYQALIALVLADGRLALMGEPGGIPSVDGSSNLAVWNPTDNSITIYGESDTLGEPASPLCGATIGIHLFGFALTADRTSILTSGLCEMNPSTGKYMLATINGDSGTIVRSPDGNYLAFPANPSSVILYDAHTLNQVAIFPVSGGNGGALNLAFSADSQTLFVSSNTSIVYAYNVATKQQVGWLSDIIVQYTSGGLVVGPATNPIYETTDATGLLVGPLEEGFGFLDTTKMQTGPVGASFTNAYVDPATGPASGGTVVQWPVPSTVTAQSPIYFGGDLSPSASLSGAFVSAITPPGNPGPADIYAFARDGGVQLIPDGYSYGPSVLQVAPNMSTAEGGGGGVIYGYGFGSYDSPAIPTGLSVEVGGKQATIVGYNPDSYTISSPPFLLESIYYTVPAGTSGTADVTVSTSAGTAAASGAMTYLPSTQQYPLPGAVLAQGIYDPYRQVYYFTDANKIQVFSLAQKEWLSPITIPVPGVGATQRLWSLALSPNGTELAVADIKADVIYVLDPSNPSSVKTYGLAPSLPPGFLMFPVAVAISDSGVVYVVGELEGGDGANTVFSLDTSTGTLTGLFPGAGYGGDAYSRAVISSDNSRVFINFGDFVWSIDTATGATTEGNPEGGDEELTLSSNQTRLEGADYLYDSNLNAESNLALNDRVIQDTDWVYGAKLSPDGSLFFQPSTNGIDVFDGRGGTLLQRISLPFALSTNYDALVTDGTDNVLIAITGATGNGIAVVDLTSLPEPNPPAYDASDDVQRLPLSVSSRATSGANGASPVPATGSVKQLRRTPAHVVSRVGSAFVRGN
jgi:YVTN family beta-propeller protein